MILNEIGAGAAEDENALDHAISTRPSVSSPLKKGSDRLGRYVQHWKNVAAEGV